MPMAASDIERLIKDAMPDAEVRIDDLRGDARRAKNFARCWRGKFSV